jgi:hypothetical protein
MNHKLLYNNIEFIEMLRGFENKQYFCINSEALQIYIFISKLYCDSWQPGQLNMYEFAYNTIIQKYNYQITSEILI